MSETKQGIHRIEPDDSLEISVEVIRSSFRTVAGEFGLTPDNCPSHPSFITLEKLEESRDRGLQFFGYFKDGFQVGFVAVEKAEAGVFYMERLAVLPGCRHKGYGMELVKHVIDFIRSNRGNKLSIGIIDEHTVLKDWYKTMGFREISTQEFEHLPFTVGFLEMELS